MALAMRKATAIALVLVFALLLSLPNRAQTLRPLKRKQVRPGHEFTFTRLEYRSWGRRQSWAVDWPKADEQFIAGLNGWVQSFLAISENPATVGIHEESLFTYPFLYIVEPGGLELSQEDAARLREYLQRGGFLMLDDFWGEYEWQNVVEQMSRIFPEYTIRTLALEHPLFHCYFDIREVVQVPNIGNWVNWGRTDEKGGIIPSYHSIEDEDGRILVFIARNTDNGDAWEWIDRPEYPLKYGLAAYRLGMNVIIYSMTH